MSPEETHESRRRQIKALANKGSSHLRIGELDEAASLYEQAIRLLGPDDDALAVPLNQNLGLVYFQLEEAVSALRVFLRALDGDFGSQQQSLRFAVTCALNARLAHLARTLLLTYQATYGPHPEGWTEDAIDTFDDD